MGPEDRPQTTSWLIAADEIQPNDRRIELVRGSGITTAATFPTRGIFAGQGSLIDLISGEKAGEMVLVPSLGQYISVCRRGAQRRLPQRPDGILRLHPPDLSRRGPLQVVKAAYQKDPRGMQRPEYDRALEGVIESKRILLPANRLVEIDRMLRFAAELKQPTILYGGRETYRPEAAELLKKSGTPVLLSMRWPEKTRDADPDETDSFRTLETRDKAASAASVLAKAGVKFALYSDGIDMPREFQRAVKKAIDAGLSRDEAVRALTLSPAEIYGVADRVGSIDKGKIANLVVTRGDIFDDRTKVELIFVDGRKYTPAAGCGGPGRPRTRNGQPGGEPMKRTILAALMALAPLGAQTIVIQNATIMTVSKGTLKGSIVVKDGKIAEVGEKVMVPQGAMIIDGSNQYVIPGIIDCHSHIAADGGINEGSVSVSSMVDIRDVLNPEDIAIYRALAGGVTTANILHGSANSIGGCTLPIKMRWGKDAQSMIFEGATPGIKFALGENPKRAGNPQGGGRGAAPTVPARYPATRMGVEDTIREAFNEAKTYKAELGRLQRQGRERRAPHSAAHRPQARVAEGSAGGQALRPLPLLPGR